MKNIIISILSTIIFYTQFSEVKAAYVPVFMFIVFAFIVFALDECVMDFRAKMRRQRRLSNKVRRLV